MEWFAEEDWLLYASPLLPMWESAPTANYSISRYLWSLRDLPGRKHVQAFWGTPARLVGARHEIALPGRRDEARIVLDAVEALRFASSRFAGALAGGLDRICARRDEVRRGRRAGCLRRGLGAVL